MKKKIKKREICLTVTCRHIALETPISNFQAQEDSKMRSASVETKEVSLDHRKPYINVYVSTGRTFWTHTYTHDQ